MELGEITDQARPYTRRSFSPLFLQGRQWLQQRFNEVGLSTHVDLAGNLVGRKDGTDPAAGVIVVGSHSDSVPSGGRFDGIAGIAAGMAIARALAAEGLALRHHLEIIDFLAEEPTEYGVSCVGSRAIAGRLSAEHLASRNPQNERLDTAIGRMGGIPSRLSQAVRHDIKAAFELHIEQGPVLEAKALDVGIVSSIAGISRIEILFQGEAAHAGTTPMDLRRDPLIAAAQLISWVHETACLFAQRGSGHFVATVGTVEVLPNAPNVVPETTRLIIDARSEHAPLMKEFRRLLEAECHEAAKRANVADVHVASLSDSMSVQCDPALRKLLRESATKLGLSMMEMASGAGHDTAFLALVAPAAMVFVPCKGGRSHTPVEWATVDSLAAGTEVILEAILTADRSTAISA